MKKFFVVLMIVLFAIGVLAACAPLQNIDDIDVQEYTRTLPTWVIIVAAVAIFFIGFGIIWKLIPGFVKVIAVIALAVVLAGTAYGVWNITWAKDVIHGAEELRDDYLNTPSADE